MQSTGHSSTHARSTTSMHGSPITYVMVTPSDLRSFAAEFTGQLSSILIRVRTAAIPRRSHAGHPQQCRPCERVAMMRQRHSETAAGAAPAAGEPGRLRSAVITAPDDRPLTLADEHGLLLRQVAVRAEELLTVAADGRWP